MPRLIVGLLLISAFLVGCSDASTGSTPVEAPPSLPDLGSEPEPKPGSIAALHHQLRSRQHTCEELTSQHLERLMRLSPPALQDIAPELQQAFAADDPQPNLNAILSLNPKVLQQARALDLWQQQNQQLQPLHCVPVIVKDNINTAHLPTTGGARVFRDNQPPEDAFILRQLQAAGALLLAKANMDEFAFGYRGESSLGGLTLNPLDTRLGAGGSSSGTAAAIAAGLAPLGLGTDTGGSIRVPAAVTGLVGLRPSMRLLSQNGIMPLANWQDTVGPLCRWAEDCALALQAMLGWDADPRSNQRLAFHPDAGLMPDAKSYQKITGQTSLQGNDTPSAPPPNPTVLQELRIGVLRSLVEDAQPQVQAEFAAAEQRLVDAGAQLVDIELPGQEFIFNHFGSLSGLLFARELEAYLQSWNNHQDQHPLTYQEVVASGGYLNRYHSTLVARDNLEEDIKNTRFYFMNIWLRPGWVRGQLDTALNTPLAGGTLDLLFYPSIRSQAGLAGGAGLSAGPANRLSAFSGYPALSFPLGWQPHAKGSLMPVAGEFLGQEFSEFKLLQAAAAYLKVNRNNQGLPKHTK